MSESSGSLHRKITHAEDLQSVVHTMKALASSSIRQYEKSVRALADYNLTIELGLGLCFRQNSSLPLNVAQKWPADAAVVGAVVFGSDQGLVGHFNEEVSDYAVKALKAFPNKLQMWAVGERVHTCLTDAGLSVKGIFSVPNSVQRIASLVGNILMKTQTRQKEGFTELHLFYNSPTSGAVYKPVSQRLLPLDEPWRRKLAGLPWPTGNIPEILGGGTATLRSLIREHLFISLFRACAKSLTSENASRLAAMQRADKNIEELLETLHNTSHRLRQSRIDEELFDVISGFEALAGPRKKT